MGGLSHYIEEEGVATVSISLVREHTEIIRPPRALWVPFELGRPLGPHNDPAFQRRVLISALELLEAETGPVLVGFPEDAPESAQEAGPLACPVNFAPPPASMTDMDQLIASFKQESAQLQSWYDRAVKQRGRTTVSGRFSSPEKTTAIIAEAAQGHRPDLDGWEGSLASALRTAVTDIKAYYHEAVSAQPGQPTDSASLNNWFWGETAAARVIDRLKRISLDSDDREMRLLGKVLLVPRTQAHRFNT